MHLKTGYKKWVPVKLEALVEENTLLAFVGLLVSNIINGNCGICPSVTKYKEKFKGKEKSLGFDGRDKKEGKRKKSFQRKRKTL